MATTGRIRVVIRCDTRQFRRQLLRARIALEPSRRRRLGLVLALLRIRLERNP